MKSNFLQHALCGFFILFGGLAFAQDEEKKSMISKSIRGKIILATRDKTDYWGTFTTLVYTEAFSRLGIDFEVRDYPLQRISHMADTQEIDGDLSRVVDYQTEHPDLIRVEESHGNLDIVAFSRKSTLRLDGWDSLKFKKLEVGYIHGSKKVHEMLMTRIPKSNIHIVHGYEAGLGMLSLERIDVFIVSRQGTFPFLKDNHFKGIPIYMSGTMDKKPLHAFLIKKHKDLAVELAKVLYEMKTEGLIAQYQKKAKARAKISASP